MAPKPLLPLMTPPKTSSVTCTVTSSPAVASGYSLSKSAQITPTATPEKSNNENISQVLAGDGKKTRHSGY